MDATELHTPLVADPIYWVAAKGLKVACHKSDNISFAIPLSCYESETILFSRYPDYGNLT